MPKPDRKHDRHIPIDHEDAWTPGDELQIDAVVGACALVAQADGWATPDERKRMIDRMRQSPHIAVFGVNEVIYAFEALNTRFEQDIDDGEAVAEDAVARLRGQPGPCRLLIETACSVAEADGGFDAEEREVILRLCRLLDIDPVRYDLVPADSDSR